MMHHPNMHHQAMSGHPPQHMAGHQGLPGHHQMPPHQIHRENRHVTLTRVGLGGSGVHGHGHGHGAALGALGGVVHHAGARAPHQPRPLHHAPQHHAQHLPPQQMKPLRRAYGPGGAYAGALPPPYAPPPRQPPPHHHPLAHTVTAPGSKMNGDAYPAGNASAGAGAGGAPAGGAGAGGAVAGEGAGAGGERAAPGDPEAARPAAAPTANSKEKTPMCLVNELARYNKIKHQYRLTSETGPAHKKVFTVTLRLGDTEEYTAEGSSIKRAQHAAASAALGATGFPPPPPRAPIAHSAPHHHHRHAGAVMPTVELNALAMKLCQPAVYTSVPPVAARAGRGRAGPPGPLRGVVGPGLAGALLYRVRVAVGGRAWLGEGATPQAARHDAAARALRDLRPGATPAPPPAPQAPPDAPDLENENGGAGAGEALGEVKSPVSLVHELALKRGLAVLFAVKSERGPPHMRVFVTACTVGELETEGEGNGKKVSKRRAAERMLAEMRRRWGPATLRPPKPDKRRHPPAKKKPRNLIKEGLAGSGGAGAGGDNPISLLAVARHAARARSPTYRVLEERGCARRREFLVQCDAPPHCATGLGPNKKAAKRRAAHNVLLAMELSAAGGAGDAADAANATADKRKEEAAAANARPGDGRQPVPGVLLMDYHQPATNGVSESAAGGAGAGTGAIAGAGSGAGAGGGSTGTSAGALSPGAKDQLLYLAQLLGFTVQFSDFPKRNHGEYLSLVSLSTEPPVMCHGGGASTAHSHEQCARAALRALALMGLDAPAPNAPAPAHAATAPE